MAYYIKYRGAKKVPVTKIKIAPGEECKKNPMMFVWPRKDWINAGEEIPTHRRKSKIYKTDEKIPARKIVTGK